MNALITKTIREIAVEVPATTRIFEEFKIDYCCGGRRTITDACAAAGIDSTALLERIDDIMTGGGRDDGNLVPEDLDPTELIDYIVAKHHAFTGREIERLSPLMAKVVMRHGKSHSELFELQIVFMLLCESLIPHMRKEENILFPYVQDCDASSKLGRPAPKPHFGTVKNPIHMLMSEHDTDGDRLRKMREITNDYALPEAACPSFTALYAGLVDLERDLHRHIHLENNVLFPAAAELEAS
jgi:regulator of cell morphogenesis and NO signaling